MEVGSDRRQLSRVPAIYAVTFEHFLGSRKIGYGYAQSVNISGRGLLFETTQPVGSNDTLILWLNAPQYALHVRGIVVHAHRTGRGLWRVGVRLDEVIEGDWHLLERDIEHRLEKGNSASLQA